MKVPQYLLGFCLLTFVYVSSVLSEDPDTYESRTLVQKHETLIKSFKVVINDYLDRFLQNAKCFILKKRLEPSPIPDQYVNIDIGHVNLTKGKLNDLSTMTRHGNAVLSYDSNLKNITIDVVLDFQDLKFTYDYNTVVILLDINGKLHGILQNVHLHIKGGFDLNRSIVFVDSIDFKHTGNIKIWLSGNEVVDSIANAMTSVLTKSLHNVVLDVIKEIATRPINSVLAMANQFLHPKKCAK